MSFLDIIIPVRNEEKNILPLVVRIDRVMKKAGIAYGIIVVDDFSTDTTIQVLEQLRKKYPLTFFQKHGTQGKAYSIIEGTLASKAEYVAMIDADLQYPPEVIPEMLSLAEQSGMVVARRQSTQDSRVRRFFSRGFQLIFGQLLFGLTCDVQSGLKVFKRDIITYVNPDDVTPWTLDIPLLTTGLAMGYEIDEVSIEFAERHSGQSKIKLLQSIREIGGHAVAFKLKGSRPVHLPPTKKASMIGAGVAHKGKHFITHTTLNHVHSAIQTFSIGQKIAFWSTVLIVLMGALMNALLTLKIVIAVLSFIYFIDVIFNLYLILKSLYSPPEINPSAKELAALKDRDLPTYSILCPLYKEAHIIPHFLKAIAAIDWPKDKLDVLLLLEEDDTQSITAARKMSLPKYVRIVVVPDSQPKTKPKACNYGLSIAKGEYLVIYDAEDIPDPLQLKKAYVGFGQVPETVKCLQAKLNYHNPHQNLLTRFFTAEYSLWFDVILTGLQSISTSIPLGGTSNHFRTKELLALQGWDPFNVTEDCDLGIRLFKQGWQTAVIDSVTLEEANSNWHNWLRQRSRWIKGYMQTYLIHMRSPVQFVQRQGVHAWLFQLTVGGKLAFILINPILWVMTFAYFALNALVGPAIEALYPSLVFYMAATSLIFGNFMFIYYFMIGCAKREHWSLLKWVYLVPLYWLMVSIAGFIALYQLIVKPHYWEKTIHGLHLKKEELQEQSEELAQSAVAEVLTESMGQKHVTWLPVFGMHHFKTKLFRHNLSQIKKSSIVTTVQGLLKNAQVRSGFALVVASMAANVLNMVTNMYLGSRLHLADFAQINTYISLLYLFNIPLGAFGITLNHQTALLFGKYNTHRLEHFFKFWVQRGLFFSILLCGIWLIAAPWTRTAVQFTSYLPVLLFAPLIVISTLSTITDSYVRGRLLFSITAVAVLVESTVRLCSSILFTQLGLVHYMYLTLPIATVVTLITMFGLMYVSRPTQSKQPMTVETSLPKKFFLLALVANLASIAYFSLDNVLVASYLPAVEAGKYAVLGLLGKMIFFSGSLTAGFILPLVSHRQGKGEDSTPIFRKLLLITALLTAGAYLLIGIAIPFASPIFFGEKINAIRSLLPLYAFGVMCYTLSTAIVRFYLAKHRYIFAITACMIAGLQILALSLFHGSLSTVVSIMTMSGVLNLVVLVLIHWNLEKLAVPLHNIQDFLDLFTRFPRRRKDAQQSDTYRILMLNWRDTRHIWAGGAEVYVHEIAKQLVKNGHHVTVFCGNDGHSPRNEKIDGVQMVRRGGFYTVYFWAMIYYIFRFRNCFDIIIDSENGIPFFTPIYARVPKFLLIHHIHQEVFREHLRFPLSYIAMCIESVLMPITYRSTPVLTVSDSSRRAIHNIGLSTQREITVINPGIAPHTFAPSRKTAYPSFAYVGRLKPYKNIETAIVAFARIAGQYPDAQFTIAGEGESFDSIKFVIKQLRLHKQVQLVGKVSDIQKARLFASSWFIVQPSTIEGWGITVIEANASGTPVIASNVTGLRDSITHEHTGLLVEAKNIKAFANAMELLITDEKLRRKLSLNALKWSKQFSWEKCGEVLLETIKMTQTQEKKTQSISTNVVYEK